MAPTRSDATLVALIHVIEGNFGTRSWCEFCLGCLICTRVWLDVLLSEMKVNESRAVNYLLTISQ